MSIDPPRPKSDQDLERERLKAVADARKAKAEARKAHIQQNTDEPTLTTGAILMWWIILLPVWTITFAFTTKVLWNWFAVPMGAPHISLWIAAGIALLARTILMTQANTTELQMSATKRLTYAWSYAIFVPAFALFLGWIYHLLAV